MANVNQDDHQIDEKKSLLRITAQDDIVLLRETVACSPINWESVAKKTADYCRKVISKRSAKERVFRLLSHFKSEDMKKRMRTLRSGTEEEIDERNTLLQDVADLHQDGMLEEKPPVKCQTTEKGQEAKGKLIRENSMQGLRRDHTNENSSDSEEDSVKRRKRNFSTSCYLKKHAENEAKKLELEERKVTMAEKKQEQEAEERRTMMDMLRKMAEKL